MTITREEREEWRRAVRPDTYYAASTDGRGLTPEQCVLLNAAPRLLDALDAAEAEVEEWHKRARHHAGVVVEQTARADAAEAERDAAVASAAGMRAKVEGEVVAWLWRESQRGDCIIRDAGVMQRSAGAIERGEHRR